MTSINAAPSQGGAASGGSIGGVYGSLGTSSATSAAAVDEQSLRIEGDGMAHLLVLTGGIDAGTCTTAARTCSTHGRGWGQTGGRRDREQEQA